MEAPKKALTALKGDEPFDLLLADMVTPGDINGKELANLARQTSPEITVVLMFGVLRGDLMTGIPIRSCRKVYSEDVPASAVRAALDQESAA